MGVVNQTGDLSQMFLDIDARLRRVEAAKTFNFPYVNSNPALPQNGDAWVRSDNSTIYIQIAGTPVALSTSASVTTLAGLADVQLSSPTNGQLLTYNSSISKWVNQTFVAVTSAIAGTGIGVSASTGAVTFTNTGVTAFTSGTGLSVNTAATGSVSVTNTGVTSNVAGTGISVSSGTGAVTITNSGVTSLVAGTNITLSGSTGAVTISATGGGASSQVTSNLTTYAMMTMEY